MRIAASLMKARWLAFVVAGGDTPTLLDLVEEPLDEITPAIQVANWFLSIALRWNIGQRALLIDERPDGHGDGANALNLLPLSAAPRTWPELLLAQASRE